MRLSIFLSTAFLAACNSAPITLQGSLAEDASATEVWVVGSTERVPIENGAFTLADVEGDTIELRFTTEGDDEPRMLLYQLPDGGAVTLDRIWFNGGSAFPLRIGLESDEPVMVNGLRMARGEALPQDVNLSATVLATSEDGDALMIRPSDEGMADIDVLITPASVLRTIDGDPVEASDLEFGDTVRVSGIGEGGRVVAAEILVSRRAADDDDDDDDDARAEDREETDTSGEPNAAPVMAAARQSNPVSTREVELARRQEEREREQEDGRGNGKGKGKGRD